MQGVSTSELPHLAFDLRRILQLQLLSVSPTRSRLLWFGSQLVPPNESHHDVEKYRHESIAADENDANIHDSLPLS